MRKIKKGDKILLGVSILVLLVCCLILNGCDQMVAPTPTPSPNPTTTPLPIPTPDASPTPAPTQGTLPPAKVNCSFKPTKVLLTNVGEYTLPAKARVVMESHYVTSDVDAGRFPRKVYPSTVTDEIKKHLDASQKIMLQEFGIHVDYSKWSHYAREWTPSEGGHIGQTAKSIRPPILEELFQGNMYYKIKPPLGTRYLFKYNGKVLVAAMGREIGPGKTKHMAGLTVEGYHYLSPGENIVEFGEAQDQTLRFGPLDCN